MKTAFGYIIFMKLLYLCYNATMPRIIRNRNDKRYVRVQDRFNNIIESFIRRGHIMKLKVRSVSDDANVYASTFYDHYKNMDDALIYAENRMKKDLHELKKTVAHNQDLEIIYLKILFFIHKHKDYYETVINWGKVSPLSQIVGDFRISICKKWRHYDKHELDRIFMIFSWEFGGVITFWGKHEHFDKTKIPIYAKKLARLSSTACERLM